MFFETYKTILYSDTLLPDIFISEYLPSMDSDCVKVYIYCLFLSKYSKQATIKELSKKLGIDAVKVKDSLIYLESLGIITRKEGSNSGIVISDLKDKELNKLYRMKSSSSPEEAALSSERNKARNSIMSTINNKYFQGLMPPSWYTDIDTWFDLYKFDEEAMFMLFNYCYNNNGMHKNYITAVAAAWNSRGIRSHSDVENYFVEYEKFKSIKGKIIKKLKIHGDLNDYERELVEKWVMEYKYDFEIIELALKRAPAAKNPGLKYFHSILTEWHDKGLSTKEEIEAYELSNAKRPGAKTTKETAIPQHANFEQRQQNEDYYDNFFSNVKKKATNGI